MLGKIHVSPASSPEKLTIVNDLAVEAIDHKVATEAASRTALNKLHLAVSKACGEVAESGKGRLSVGEGVTMANGEASTGSEPSVAAAAGEEDGLTKVVEDDGETVDGAVVRQESGEQETILPGGGAAEEVTKDSILDELLDDDEDVEMTGM